HALEKTRQHEGIAGSVVVYKTIVVAGASETHTVAESVQIDHLLEQLALRALPDQRQRENPSASAQQSHRLDEDRIALRWREPPHCNEPEWLGGLAPRDTAWLKRPPVHAKWQYHDPVPVRGIGGVHDLALGVLCDGRDEHGSGNFFGDME